MKKVDLTGKVFGSLTVLEDVGRKRGHRAWKCKCKCGGESIVASDQLLRSDGRSTKSCYACRNIKTWEPIFEDNICKIPLNNGGEAIIDKEDFDKVRNVCWRTNSFGYVHHHMFKQKSLWLAKVIMGAGDGIQVDHINRNKLDNRKQNLRIATASQNCMNRRSLGSNTGVKGVSKHKYTGKYQVQIMANGKNMYLGQFVTLEEAKAVRQQAEIDFHKEFRYQP